MHKYRGKLDTLRAFFGSSVIWVFGGGVIGV
jgi:hypothetical protein